MAGATNAEEAAILNARLDVSGNYIALYTALPADDGTGGTEVTGGSYARVSIASTDWNAASGGAPTTKTGPKSGVDWTFNAPSANWGTVLGFGIFDASTSGNLKYFGSLTTSQTINNGDPAPKFDSTHVITIQLGDPSDTY